MPRFSVIIYNIDHYPERCLLSLQRQTFPDFEVIIVDPDDNKSVDCGSAVSSIPREYRIIRSADRESRNAGIDHASGDYLFFLSAHDYLLPETLEIADEVLSRNQDDILVTGYRAVTSNDEEYIEISRAFIHYTGWSAKNFICQCFDQPCIFYRAGLFKENGLRWPEQPGIADHAFLPVLALFAKTIGNIGSRLLQCGRDKTSPAKGSYRDLTGDVIDSCDRLLSDFQAYGQYEPYQTELEFHVIRAALFDAVPEIFAASIDFDKADLLYRYVEKQFPGFRENKYIQTRIRRSRKEFLITSGNFRALRDEFYEQPIVQARKYLEKQSAALPGTGDILLSVILPIYNVERYLLDCLISVINNIKAIEAEVIMIDDGSEDTGGAIALMFAEKFPNFYYYKQTNQGLSTARNNGIEKARGKYIIFLDSDDAVYEGMYENMIRAAERDRSDMVICPAVRGYDTKADAWRAYLMERVTPNLRAGIIDIRTAPQLVNDTYSWNKLVRRDFYLAHQFHFVEGKHFQDMPVSLLQHFFASKVSYLPQYLYFYRIHENGNKSATQEKDDSRVLELLEMLEFTISEAGKNSLPDHLLTALKGKILSVLIPTDLKITRINSYIHPERILEAIRRFLVGNFTGEDFARQSVPVQKMISALLNNDPELLYRVCRFREHFYTGMPCFIEEGKPYRKLPSDLFGIDREPYFSEPFRTAPGMKLISVSEGPVNIKCRAYLYYPRIPVSAKQDRTNKIFLEDPVTLNSVCLQTTLLNGAACMKEHTRYISNYDNSKTTYDCSGTVFQFTLNKDEVIRFMDSASGQVLLRVEYQTPYYSGCSYLRNSAGLPKNLFLSKTGRIRMAETHGRQICLEKVPYPKKEMVSVIIPVYNAAGSLPNLAESVINQTYKNLEIIFVNDGSKDNSGEICDSYAAKDPRVRVYHLSHGGFAKACNYALERFTGNYLMIAGTDMILSTNHVSRLRCLLKDSSCHAAACNSLSDGDKSPVSGDGSLTETQKVISCQNISYREFSRNPLSGMLFDRFAVKNIRFDEQCGRSADILFFAETMKRIKRYLLTGEALFRTADKQSLSAMPSLRCRYDEIRVWRQIYRMQPAGSIAGRSCLMLVIMKTKEALCSHTGSDETDRELRRKICHDLRELKKEPMDYMGRFDRIKNRIFISVPEIYIRAAGIRSHLRRSKR